MGNLKDTVLEFVGEYRKFIFMGLGAIVVGFLLWAVLSEGKTGEKEKIGSREELEVSLEKARELQETFSEFDKVQVAPSSKMVAYDINLYIKKPFLSKSEVDKAVSDYIELLKYQTNDEKTDTYLVGARITIYDREEVYRKGLAELGTFTYMLKEEDEKKKKKEDEYLTGEDMRWEYTITQTKKPDYEKYFIKGIYTEMKPKLGVTPLSDEEFSFYLKLNKYSALRGGSLNGGVKLYLQWDLGRDTSKDGLVVITKEFKKFTDRVTELKGSKKYYTDLQKLKQELSVENPRFLVYALTGEVIDDKVTAKRRLIKLDSKFYLKAYLEDAKKKLKEGIDDTSSQDAIDGGELTDDEVSDIQENPGTLGETEDNAEWDNSLDEFIFDEGGGEYGSDNAPEKELYGVEDESFDMGEPMHKDDEELDEPVGKK